MSITISPACAAFKCTGLTLVCWCAEPGIDYSKVVQPSAMEWEIILSDGSEASTAMSELSDLSTWLTTAQQQVENAKPDVLAILKLAEGNVAVLQRAVRAWLKSSRIRRLPVRLQAFQRMRKQRFTFLLMLKAARLIQAHLRGWVHRVGRSTSKAALQLTELGLKKQLSNVTAMLKIKDEEARKIRSVAEKVFLESMYGHSFFQGAYSYTAAAKLWKHMCEKDTSGKYVEVIIS